MMMKRTGWFLILAIILLSACSTRLPVTQASPTVTPRQPVIEKTQNTPVVTATLPSAVTQPIPVSGNSGQANTPATDIAATPVKTEAASAAEASVGVGGLNLRYGPGLNYPVARVLAEGQKVRLEGRSRDGDWIVARLSDGTAGWVFGAYLQSTSNLAALPMLEASGGPVTVEPQPQATTTAPSKRYSLNMAIQDNQAVVSLARFPANQDLMIRLGVPGGDPSMTVATGKTDETGAASFAFEMPVTWPDGSPLTQSQLRLTATTADGSFSRGANITYGAGE
jgi:uncharacterized protein YraI